MAETLEHARVAVNGTEIPPAAIAAEAQHHPAGTPQEALRAASEALVIRQLLLDEAERLGVEGHDINDDEGRPLSREEAQIEALLASQVKTPKADEAPF